jgi:hypothetical protein
MRKSPWKLTMLQGDVFTGSFSNDLRSNQQTKSLYKPKLLFSEILSTTGTLETGTLAIGEH